MLEKVLTGKLTFHSLTPCDLSKCNKSEIKAYFLNSYDLNESLFTALKDEEVMYKCPDRLRLPLIFYYAHTACVYMNKLILAGLLNPSDRINLSYETLFETGVDEMSWDDTENYRMGGAFKWPPLDDVIDYRRKVKAVILRLIDETPLQLPVTMDSPWWGLFMGMDHERIHLETSSVLIRQLPVEMVERPPKWTYAPPSTDDPVMENPLIKVTTSTDVKIGKPFNFPSYGWDNEYGQWNITVPPFEASKYLITNREFLEFVEDGGYSRKELWTDEGWEWVEYRKAKHPSFWVCDKGCKAGVGNNLGTYSHCKPEIYNGVSPYCNGHSNVDANGHQGKDEGGGNPTPTYRYRAMFDIIPLPLDWPVDVNYHEAKAFCTWKGDGFRLPSEAEHNVMRGALPSFSKGTGCDIIFQEKPAANLNLHYGSSTPVNMYAATDTGFHDVFGNVWKWMEDHYNGLPGTKTHHLYDDYSTPCYDGRHNVMLGGSWISTGDEGSRFARYAFRRHFFQHAGFRLCRSLQTGGSTVKVPIRLINNELFVQGIGIQDNPVCLDKKAEFLSLCSANHQLNYEGESHLYKALQEYAPGNKLPQLIAQECKQAAEQQHITTNSALHIGCGTGRITFELSKLFQQVVAIDFSGRFIDACQTIQEGGVVPYWMPQHKNAKRGRLAASLDDPKVNMDRILFKQMTWLPNEIGFHNFILYSSVDRVLQPKAWFIRFREVLKPGGLLAITSQTGWDGEKISQYIGQQFALVSTKNLTNDKSSVCITFWKHK